MKNKNTNSEKTFKSDNGLIWYYYNKQKKERPANIEITDVIE